MSLRLENLRNFLAKHTAVGEMDIGGATPLFSSGLLDSTSMVELIAFLECESGTRIDFGDVTVENFDTMDSILRFVSS